MKKLLDIVLLRRMPELFWICGFYLLAPPLVIGMIWWFTETSYPKLFDYVVAAPLLYAVTAAVYCAVSGRNYLLENDTPSKIRKIEDQLRGTILDEFEAAKLIRIVRAQVPPAKQGDVDQLLGYEKKA